MMKSLCLSLLLVLVTTSSPAFSSEPLKGRVGTNESRINRPGLRDRTVTSGTQEVGTIDAGSFSLAGQSNAETHSTAISAGIWNNSIPTQVTGRTSPSVVPPPRPAQSQSVDYEAIESGYANSIPVPPPKPKTQETGIAGLLIPKEEEPPVVVNPEPAGGVVGFLQEDYVDPVTKVHHGGFWKGTGAPAGMLTPKQQAQWAASKDPGMVYRDKAGRIFSDKGTVGIKAPEIIKQYEQRNFKTHDSIPWQPVSSPADFKPPAQ